MAAAIWSLKSGVRSSQSALFQLQLHIAVETLSNCQWQSAAQSDAWSWTGSAGRTLRGGPRPSESQTASRICKWLPSPHDHIQSISISIRITIPSWPFQFWYFVTNFSGPAVTKLRIEWSPDIQRFGVRRGLPHAVSLLDWRRKS